MAHIAKISELAESLITNVAGFGRDEQRFRQILNETTKGLRNSGYARTNQFEVRSKLDGLVEKFSIINREDLSEALQSRLDELPTTSKWLPEFLSLLLLLSDRPAEETTLESLEDTVAASEEHPSLTWKEILANEITDGSGIWDDVERGYHSSGDEATVDEDDDTVSTHATSVEEEDLGSLARRYLVQPDESVLEDIRNAHARIGGQSSTLSTSELVLIRESLSMLQGLPTSVYSIDSSTGKVSYSQRFTLDTATQLVLNDMLASGASMGSSLNSLRRWIQTQHGEHYLQSCQATVQSLLAQFGSQLAALERKYVSTSAHPIVSFIDVWSVVESSGRSLVRLSRLVQESQNKSRTSPFSLLDLLFEETCAAQLSGDSELSATMGSVLIAGLRIYLKPVSTWVQNGMLPNHGQTFFIVEANKDYEPRSIWYDRFAMPELPDELFHIPLFLQHLAGQIFALGKSRAFLIALNGSNKENYNEIHHELPELTFLEKLLNSGSLTPFSQMLDDTLSAWIISIHSDCASVLCNTLVEEHGLLRTFDGLANLFCSKDGNLFQTFADTLFWRMDTGRRWTDDFLLTELAQTTLGNSAGLDPQAVSVHLVDSEEEVTPVSSILHLERLRLQLEFTWPIQNITRLQSPISYSNVFALLLQVYRAKYLLRFQVLGLRGLTHISGRLSQRLSVGLKLRQALLAAVDTLHDHVTSTVSMLSAVLHQNVKAAEDVDAMANIWAEHEKQMDISLLLAQNLKPLRDTITRLLRICEEFHDVWKALLGKVKYLGDDERDDVRTITANDRPSVEPSSRRTALEIQADLEDSLSFITPGLRATSRASGNNSLEALADRLQWCSLKR